MSFGVGVFLCLLWMKYSAATLYHYWILLDGKILSKHDNMVLHEAGHQCFVRFTEEMCFNLTGLKRITVKNKKNKKGLDLICSWYQVSNKVHKIPILCKVKKIVVLKKNMLKSEVNRRLMLLQYEWFCCFSLIKWPYAWGLMHERQTTVHNPQEDLRHLKPNICLQIHPPYWVYERIKWLNSCARCCW